MAAGLATLTELQEHDLVGRRARLGDYLLTRTRPLVEAFDVVKEVRGIGLMWAIEFGEPRSGSHTWRFLEARQPGIFAQFVVGPLFREHHILSQVAGHSVNVLKGLPPLVLDEADVDWFATALEQVIEQAQRLPRAVFSFGAHAAAALPRRLGGSHSGRSRAGWTEQSERGAGS